MSPLRSVWVCSFKKWDWSALRASQDSALWTCFMTLTNETFPYKALDGWIPWFSDHILHLKNKAKCKADKSADLTD